MTQNQEVLKFPYYNQWLDSTSVNMLSCKTARLHDSPENYCKRYFFNKNTHMGAIRKEETSKGVWKN